MKKYTESIAKIADEQASIAKHIEIADQLTESIKSNTDLNSKVIWLSIGVKLGLIPDPNH